MQHTRPHGLLPSTAQQDPPAYGLTPVTAQHTGRPCTRSAACHDPAHGRQFILNLTSACGLLVLPASVVVLLCVATGGGVCRSHLRPGPDGLGDLCARQLMQ